MSRRETLRVEESQPKARLDKFLQGHFPETSRGTFQRLIENGNVRVDDQPTKATHHPRAGEAITIEWPEAIPSEAIPEDIPLDILFEDDHLLVLNKRAGIVVHPAAGHESNTLVNALLHHCAGQLSGIGGVARPGIVHRLDKDTSGCLVVAKNDDAHLALSAQFADRTTTKIYHALVCGQPSKPKHTVKEPLARHPVHRKKIAITPNGRDAHTDFRVLELLNKSALIEATLHTGRTHQIRVHLQHLGCPVVGDAVYGGRPTRAFTQATSYTAPRQLLHAFTLSFDHPASGKRLTLEAPLPDDFQIALDLLRAE
ncbi:MAG: RluA family pseudouridine synthase [Verrucomicrobia subdivision 3 bacterium]|nr:RluA family pseudouridine synthase [Limisphaerales bacterium]